MATAKKTSTKKKTTTKRSVSAKTTKKSVSKKPVVSKKKASKLPKANPPMVTLEKLFKFNIFSAVTNIGFAVLSVIFLSSASVTLLWAHATKDDLAATENALAPAFTNIVTVEVRYLLALLFGISAIFSILLATKLRAKYEKGIDKKVSALRWIFVGITSALTLEIVSVLGGVVDSGTLKLVGGLIFITSILGWLSEVQNKSGKKDFAPFYLSLFTGALAWVPLVMSLVGTSLYGIENFSWYVYALAVLVLAGFISFALNQYRYIKGAANSNEYLEVEGRYVSSDFLIKLAVFVVTFIAFYK